jgi:hypothetical protein
MFSSKYFKLLLFITIELILLYTVNYYGINLDKNLKYLVYAVPGSKKKHEQPF